MRSAGSKMSVVNSLETAQGVSPFAPVGEVVPSSGDSDVFGEVLVGRAKELNSLRQGVASAVQGRGTLFTITGESGIGKTTLAAKLVDITASLGAAAFWGRCWEGGGAPEYWPWIQIIRSLVPKVSSDFGARLSRIVQTIDGTPRGGSELTETLAFNADQAKRDRFRLFSEIADLIQSIAKVTPLVLVFDDLHAADHASLSFLRFLARGIHDHPIVLIGTYRESEMKSQQELAALTVAIERQGLEIPLKGLTKSDVEAFVERRLGRVPPRGLVATVHDITGGNPFFIDELLKPLKAKDGSPDQTVALSELLLSNRIQHAILRDMAPVSAGCRKVLLVASAIGQDVPLQMLRLICERTDRVDPAIAEARSAGILVGILGAPSSVRFRHALLRETLYEGLSTSERAELHRRIGEALEAVKESSVVKLSEVAHHFWEAFRGGASTPEKVIQYCSEAAQCSLNALAYEEAASHYMRAVEGSSLLNPRSERHAALTLSLGKTLAKTQQSELAKQTFWSALETAKSVNASVVQGEAVLEIAGQWPSSAADGKLIAIIDDALTAIGGSDTSTRARLLSRSAVEFYWSNRRDEMLQLTQQAVEMATRLDDPSTLIYTWLHRRFALAGPDHTEELQEACALIKALARKRANKELDLEATFWNIAHLLERGEVSTADLELATAASLVREVRLPWFNWYEGILKATRALQMGRFEEGEKLAEEALQAGEEAGRRSLAALYNWSHLLLIRREQNRLSEFEDFGRALAQQLPWFYPVRCDLIFICSEIGKHAEVLSELEGLAASGFSLIPRDALWFRCICLLAEASWNTRASLPSTVLYDLLLPYGAVNVCSGEGGACLGSAERYLGLLAGAKGDWDSAIHHLARGIDANSHMGASPWTGRAYYDYASMRLARGFPGDLSEADGALDKAIVFAEAAGMKYLRGLAQDLHEEIHSRSSTVTFGRTSDPAVQPPGAALGEASQLANLFRKEDEIWTIVYAGETLQLRDFKGLNYISQLLRNPGQEFHAASLVTGVDAANGPEDSEARVELGLMTQEQLAERNLRAGAPEDAGVMLDAQAKAAYGHRLKQLREELEEAKEFRNPERIAKAEDEIDAISRELSRGIGRGGRHRRAGSASERARLSVTSAIKSAIERIAEKHSRLAAHLSASIRTGTFCCYRPDRQNDPAWHF